MNAVHNARNAQIVAVTLTLVLELLFALLGAWTLGDFFLGWGVTPAVLIAILGGIVLFLLYLYVFIYREYAQAAARLFSARMGEGDRTGWGTFLAIACIVMDSFFNANRLSLLPQANPWALLFMWIALEIFVLIPFALGKLVHAHVNTVDKKQARALGVAEKIDVAFQDRLEKMLPNMTVSELLQLKKGDLTPISQRIVVESQPVQKHTDPLLEALTGLGGLSEQTARAQ